MAAASTMRPGSLELALTAALVAEENRGRDVVILDLTEVTPICDYFVIATGTSRRQLHAIADDIDNRVTKELGETRIGIEGYQDSRWILLDYGTVVVHMLDKETREFYDLENLWAEAKRVERTSFVPAPKLAVAAE
jgi:ribosome-associated protein